MRTHSFTLAVIGIVSLAGLSACSSQEPLARAVEETVPPVVAEDPPSEEPAEEETEEPELEDPDLPSNEDIQEYVEAIGTANVATIQGARELAVPDSPADGYLRYQVHLRESDKDAGFTSDDAARAHPIEDGFELCWAADQCAALTDFVGENGAIYSFEVEGLPLEERLTVGDGSRIEGPGGSEIEFVAAYENATGSHLFVAYELHSGTTGLSSPLASYRGPSGRQSESEVTSGAFTLAPDSMSYYVSIIAGGGVGGDLYLQLFDDDGWELSTVTIPATED